MGCQMLNTVHWLLILLKCSPNTLLVCENDPPTTIHLTWSIGMWNESQWSIHLACEMTHMRVHWLVCSTNTDFPNAFPLACEMTHLMIYWLVVPHWLFKCPLLACGQSLAIQMTSNGMWNDTNCCSRVGDYKLILEIRMGGLQSDSSGHS
jgi:hypothetical protein